MAVRLAIWTKPTNPVGCYHYQCTTSIAQLWQRDRAKIDNFSINVQRYLQTHAQNVIFGPPFGASGAMYALCLKFFTQQEIRSVEHGICPIAELTSPWLNCAAILAIRP